jgi:hypothetical protein
MNRTKAKATDVSAYKRSVRSDKLLGAPDMTPAEYFKVGASIAAAVAALGALAWWVLS